MNKNKLNFFSSSSVILTYVISANNLLTEKFTIKLKYDEVNFAKKLEIRRKKIKENTIL
jgi:hypothetical protein